MFLNLLYNVNDSNLRNYLKSIHKNFIRETKAELKNKLIAMDFSEETALKLIDNAIERRRQEGRKTTAKTVDELLKCFVSSS